MGDMHSRVVHVARQKRMKLAFTCFDDRAHQLWVAALSPNDLRSDEIREITTSQP